MRFGRFKGRRTLVTGHTGFKGAWLTSTLLQLEANVTGLSLADPPSQPSLFQQTPLVESIDHRIGDIRDFQAVAEVVAESQPEFVFHLAAQPLVRRSYLEPMDTFATNVMGTLHVLEAIRQEHKEHCVVILVTTDKCYENREWVHAYRETDRMGGHDPYSASKGCAELAISSFRRSFFADHAPVSIASVRAGNVIGGGDWVDDRILPDCIRSISQGIPVDVRNKSATRPWQHVMDPISGYLALASAIDEAASAKCSARLAQLCDAYNFGPSLSANRTVKELVEELLIYIPGEWIDKSDPNAVHEATRLNLTIDKAYHNLDWTPTWEFSRAVRKTAEWYEAYLEDGPERAWEVMQAQILDYLSLWQNTSPNATLA